MAAGYIMDVTIEKAAELLTLRCRLAQQTKQAAAESVGVNPYAPVQPRRALTDQEERDIARGKRQWLPQIFQHYGTPIPSMMASPWKQGLMAALAAGGIGALAGGHIGSSISNSSPASAGIGAAVGGLGLGGLAGVVTGLERNAKNQGLVELMKRLPENAVKRDLLSDPAYQQDKNRDTTQELINALQPRSTLSALPGLSKFSAAAALGIKTADFDLNKVLTNLGQGHGGYGATPFENAAWESGRNALIGAGVGGIGGALHGAMSDDEDKQPLGQALRGALVGGALGGGGTAAYRGLEGATAPAPSVTQAEGKAEMAKARGHEHALEPSGNGGVVGDYVVDPAIRTMNSSYDMVNDNVPGGIGTVVGGELGAAAGLGINSLENRYNWMPRAARAGAKEIDSILGNTGTPPTPGTPPVYGPVGMPSSPGTPGTPGTPSVGDLISQKGGMPWNQSRPLTAAGQAGFVGSAATPEHMRTLRGGLGKAPGWQRGLVPLATTAIGALLGSNFNK